MYEDSYKSYIICEHIISAVKFCRKDFYMTMSVTC